MPLRVESNLAKTSSSTGYLAIDIGGTKLAVGVVSTSGELLSRMQTQTPSTDVWGALKKLIDAQMLQTEVRIEACGVGCGGPMTLGGESVSPLNIPDWRGFRSFGCNWNGGVNGSRRRHRFKQQTCDWTFW
jgi:predicted NBD/HSP70 family sugar kinase